MTKQQYQLQRKKRYILLRYNLKKHGVQWLQEIINNQFKNYFRGKLPKRRPTNWQKFLKQSVTRKYFNAAPIEHIVINFKIKPSVTDEKTDTPPTP